MQPLSEMGRFATVVIDPPWPVSWSRSGKGRKSGQNSFIMYETMNLQEIAGLPMGPLLLADAHVFLWTTQAFLRHSFRLIESWGCDYSFTMTWVKTGYLVNKPIGYPFYNTEWIVVGKRGKPEFLDTRQFRCANAREAHAHSEKPEEFYDLLRRVTPEPRLDIFGRRAIAGFHSWGNEAPEGDPPPNQYQDVLDLGEGINAIRTHC